MARRTTVERTGKRLVVALTGGIASGKSAVASRFATLGANVLDADVVARELVIVGSPALDEIIAAFGAEALNPDGELDRPAMRQRIFADRGARTMLEAILHPRVRDALRERAAAPIGPYSLLVVPLLAENASHYAWVDRVLLVDVPRGVQRERLLARDGVDAHLADAMLDAQDSRAQRLAIADDVIDNSATMDALDARVHALHERYVTLAKARATG